MNLFLGLLLWLHADPLEHLLQAELARFLPDDFDRQRLAKEHRTWIELQATLGGWEEEQRAWQWSYTNQALHCWDALYYARSGDFGLEFRLDHLASLRRLLGEEAYLAGMMPAPVPYWVFRDCSP